ncbi:MAG: c-type cytochrome [Erythrobacter sp.]|nr:MAG: c-type cytochrome [Erythrobacter sp.]
MWESTGEIIALGGGDAGARGACATCHGLQGEGDGNLVPRLAGLDPGYFARQMEYFAEGQRRHPQMAWIAGRLDWSARQKVAVHYSGMPFPDDAAQDTALPTCAAAELYHRGDPDRGLPSCASCHGEDGTGTGPGNPPLAGQPAHYLARQLQAWSAGERYGDPDRVMTRISQLLTAREMASLADYSSDLRGGSGHSESPEACLPERRPDPRNGA